MNNTRNTIIRFCLRALLFASPIIIVLGLYVVLDPFRVVRNYEDPTKNGFIILNKDHVSTELYLGKAPKQQYNSFIFGSSRTMAYRHSDWLTHLPKGAVPFSFDAHQETLWGIEKKVRTLDKLGTPLDNIVLLIDPLNTFTPMTNSSGQLYIKDPRISGESKFVFQKSFLESWFSDLFFVKYLDYTFFGTVRPYMEGMLTIDNSNLVDPVSGERNIDIEASVQLDEDAFYNERSANFYARDTTQFVNYPAMITSEHEVALNYIAAVFRDHGSLYEIVISPAYDLQAIAPEDKEKLVSIFGKEHVHDYSGMNSITTNQHNYFESSHYRPHVGRWILDDIYNKDHDKNASGNHSLNL